MGYAHGRRWNNDNEIISAIKEVADVIMISRMPSRNEIESVMKNSSLTNIISKRGGFSYWAKRCGYETKECETKTGKENEFRTELLISELCGLDSIQMTTKHQFDLLVGEFVKVDVKSGKKYNYVGSGYYSFNLEKDPATCDIYVCHCLDDDSEIVKTFVIPSIAVRKNQLSVGEKSMYDKFIDAWHYINVYNDFYKNLKSNF